MFYNLCKLVNALERTYENAFKIFDLQNVANIHLGGVLG